MPEKCPKCGARVSIWSDTDGHLVTVPCDAEDARRAADEWKRRAENAESIADVRANMVQDLQHDRDIAYESRSHWCVEAGRAMRRAEMLWRAVRVYRRLAQDRGNNQWAATHLIRAMRFARGISDQSGNRLPNDLDNLTYREWTGKDPLK